LAYLYSNIIRTGDFSYLCEYICIWGLLLGTSGHSLRRDIHTLLRSTITTPHMDLLFTKESPKNTTLSLPDGKPVYEITTPTRHTHTETTTIRKYQSDGSADDVGTIEFHVLHKDICQIRGRDFRPESLSIFNSYVPFVHLNVSLIILLARRLSPRRTEKYTRGNANRTRLRCVV